MVGRGLHSASQHYGLLLYVLPQQVSRHGRPGISQTAFHTSTPLIAPLYCSVT